ncbi:MAG: hypothetical protein DRJ97_03020 [Thermoprotei archaeon]|nr:MAG: hypothetical protein DRJ97_03020 [Thermoprotei archaeon]
MRLKLDVARLVDEARRLSSLGELVSGSSLEEEVVEQLRGSFEASGWEVKVYSYVSLSWRERYARLQVGDLEAECLAMPYTLSSIAEGGLVYVGPWPKEGLEGRVALMDLNSDDLDLAKEQCLAAAEAGASACIFIDPYLDDGSRRIVVTGAEGYGFGRGAPSPIPCASVTRRLGALLRKLAEEGVKVRVEVEAEVFHGASARVLEATLEGSVDEEVLVTAHHDHWLTGFSDNCLGVAFLLELARLLPRSPRRRVRLISFGAEEQGSLGFSSWYWIHGSRSYVEHRARRGDLERVEAVLNVDVLARPPLTVGASDFNLQSLLTRAAEAYGLTPNVELDNPYCDSYSFTMAGLPACTLHSFDQCIPFYHSTKDTAEQVHVAFIRSSLSALLDVIVKLAYRRLKVRGPRRLNSLVDKLRGLNVGQSFISRLKRLALVRGDRWLASILFKAVSEGPYSEPGAFKVSFAPELSLAVDVKRAEEALRLLEADRAEEALRALEGLDKPKFLPGLERPLPRVEVAEVIELARLGEPPRAVKKLKEAIALAKRNLKLLKGELLTSS